MPNTRILSLQEKHSPNYIMQKGMGRAFHILYYDCVSLVNADQSTICIRRKANLHQAKHCFLSISKAAVLCAAGHT